MALPGVGHHESNFRSVGGVDPIEAGDADDGTVDPRDDGLAVAMVDVRESVDLVGAELGMHGEEPKVGRFRGQGVVEANQVSGVPRPHRAQVDQGAVCERDGLDTCRPRQLELLDRAHELNVRRSDVRAAASGPDRGGPSSLMLRS